MATGRRDMHFVTITKDKSRVVTDEKRHVKTRTR